MTAFDELFHQRPQSIQYNAAIAITGTIRGTSLGKRFEEVGLETLKSGLWFRKLHLLTKYFIANHLVTFFN